MSPSPDTNTASLLVVDDDLVTQARLNAYFSQEGYRVLLAGDGETFWQQLEHAAVDLVLLDINLPGQDGLSLARELRARDAAIGIILLTSRNDDIDKIVGLEVGADDYVTKPFNPRELLVRARNLLWRVAQCAGSETREAEQGCFRFEGWTLNPHKRQLVSPDGRIERLPQGEFKLLMALLSHAGQVLSRDQLMDAIHDREWTPNDRTVDVLVGRVRRKLDDNPADPRLILTAHGAGYLFAGELD